MNFTNITASENTNGNFWFQFTLVLITTPLFVLTIIGNALVIIIWFIHKPIRTPQNAYLFSLAIVDFLTGIFVIPFNVAYSYRRRWDFGLPLCRIWHAGGFLLNSITAYHLVVIAADRYRALTEGVAYLQSRSMKSVIEIVIVIWILGLWVAGPQILDSEHIYKAPIGQKHCIAHKNTYWVAHIWFASFGFPAFLIIRIYSKVFLEIRRRLGLRKVGEPSGSTNPTSSDCIEDKMNSDTSTSTDASISGRGSLTSANNLVVEVSDAKRRLQLEKEKRSAITLGIVILAFLVCGAPWYSLILYDAVVPVEYRSSPYLTMFAAFFALANSGFNPIVYAARVPDFQLALRKMYNSVLKAFRRITAK